MWLRFDDLYCFIGGNMTYKKRNVIDLKCLLLHWKYDLFKTLCD